MFYDNLIELCKTRGVKVTNVVTALGCSQGSLSTWKSGATPRADTLKKFADFFNVPVDVLVKGVDVASSQRTFSRAFQKRSVSLSPSYSRLMMNRSRSCAA